MKIYLIALFITFVAIAFGANHNVVVGGNGGPVFTPNFLNVAVADSIVFQFNTSGSNVRQTIDTSCIVFPNGFQSANYPNDEPVGSTYTYSVGTGDKGKTLYATSTPNCTNGMKFRFAVNSSSTIAFSFALFFLISMFIF